MMKRKTNVMMTAVPALILTVCGNVYANGNISSGSGQPVSLAKPAEESLVENGESLKAWEREEGWTAFYTFTRDDNLKDAWEAAAEAFGPVIGMDDLDGDGLKALNVQVCGLEDDIVDFEFDGNTITALDSRENIVFSNEYDYVTMIENAIEGAGVYVYRTEDSDAGKYTCLCLTLPAVESDEGGVMTYFRLRYAADNYEDLFAEDYSGTTGVMVDSSTSEEDLDYTIRLLYGAEVKR